MYGNWSYLFALWEIYVCKMAPLGKHRSLGIHCRFSPSGQKQEAGVADERVRACFHISGGVCVLFSSV